MMPLSLQMFEVNQTLSTSGAYDWEFFSVGPFHFLVVANTFDGQTTSINSTAYVWVDGRFQTFQNISVSVALTWRPGVTWSRLRPQTNKET